MARPRTYDNGSWHRGNGFPDDYDAIHIALFVKWCFSKGWAEEEFWADCAAEIGKLLSGEMSAVEFFESQCDDKFFPEMLSEEGNRFVETYYNDTYIDDFLKIEREADSPADISPDTDLEHIPFASEEAMDFDKFSELLDRRLAEFEAAEAERKNRPWYKFW